MTKQVLELTWIFSLRQAEKLPNFSTLIIVIILRLIWVKISFLLCMFYVYYKGQVHHQDHHYYNVKRGKIWRTPIVWWFYILYTRDKNWDNFINLDLVLLFHIYGRNLHIAAYILFRKPNITENRIKRHEMNIIL